MSFWDGFKDLGKFIQGIKSFFDYGPIQESQVYDVNPVLTDRAEFGDIQMNEALSHYIMLDYSTAPRPANDDLLFSLDNRNDSNIEIGYSVNDMVDEDIIIPEFTLNQDKSNFLVSPFEGESLHLHVTAEDVLEMGNHIIIDGSEISMLSFQDDGWIKLENDNIFPEGIENIQGYHIYIHDTGAILQIDGQIEITPPEI